MGSSSANKVRFFFDLFRCRTDVYAVRWENRRDGRSGWMPAIKGHWRKGMNRADAPYLPLTTEVVDAHLRGEAHIGLYPLGDDDTCCWVAADFDKEAAMLDALAYMKAARSHEIPAALEVSQSGRGAHVWIFFAHAISASVARTEDGFKLGNWVGAQRAKFTKGLLEPDQVQRLEALNGWSWNPHEDQWEEFYRRFADHVATKGTTRIRAPLVVDGYNVWAWVNRQRNAYAKGRMLPDRQRRLESLTGWAWDARADKWEEGYQQTAEYADRHGTARVPFSYKTNDGYQLGSWVNTQRVNYAQGKLSPERQHRLESLRGWVWRTRPPNRAPRRSHN